MTGRAHLYVGGAVLLLALAGCGRSMLMTGERPAWREQAEVECVRSGAVKVGAGVVQIKPIEGPGMCGATYPFKVAALGESSALGYAQELRPPSAIPNVSSSQMPRWPVNAAPRYAPPPPPVQTMQTPQGQMRWVPGAPAIEPPQTITPQQTGYPPQNYPQAAPQEPRPQPRGWPVSLAPPGIEVDNDDIPDDAIMPRGRAVAPRSAPSDSRPVYQPQQPLPALGPSRGPQTTGAIMPAVVTPAATLSCPIVSALDRWVTTAVQPAALKWFGSQVVEIKQISAYSCRSMVGARTSRISEHAFGNALDVAGFVLADGRRIIIKNSWRGSPEEQGFLHDVQLQACEIFTTVLAPGYNAAHYDHFHFDLMRRANGRRPCQPAAIPGEVVAARARAVYASKQRGPAYTGSISTKAGRGSAGVTTAVPGEDGFFEDDADGLTTGSIAPSRGRWNAPLPLGADGSFDGTEVEVVKPSRYPAAAAAGDAAIRAQETRGHHH